MLLLLFIGAAVIFWAGLSLGSGPAGRSDEERAAIEAFAETYQRIADDYIGTPLPDALLEGAIEGMFEVLDDPYSRYMPPDEYDSALDDAMGEFEGIGAVMVTKDEAGEACEPIDEACRLRVTRVLTGAPAEEAGLEADDIVIAVDGDSLDGFTIDDSVMLIRGPRDSEVTLTVVRDGAELELPITRDRVTTEDVHTASLADGSVGYIGIDNFSANAAADFEQALEAHLAAGVEGLVIDVRDDPGGFVDATVEISSQFLDDGPVFWEEDAGGRQVAVEASAGGLAADQALEVAVLVNGGTASASEILGGALQDAGRATLVGEPTFGKGTVQEWSELPGDNGGFRLSVAKWLTRDKHWVEGRGLQPDVIVPLDGERFWPGEADADPEGDQQLQSAIAVVVGEPAPGPQPPAGPSPGTAATGSAAPVE
ncbi:MAG: S41 family peptidase [Chloroflexota bacterium]